MMHTLVKDIGPIRIITVLTDIIQFHNYEEVFSKIRGSISDMNCIIVLDMGRVKFMDSLSLGMLVPVQLLARRMEGEVAYVVSDPKIMELLNQLRLNEILEIFSTIEEALAYLAGGLEEEDE